MFLQRNPFLAKYLEPDHVFNTALVITHVFPGTTLENQHVLEAGQILKKINGMEVRSIPRMKARLEEIRLSGPAFTLPGTAVPK